MRFVSSLSRVFLVACAVTGVVAVPAEKSFGANFALSSSDEAYVQGGFTIVDNANFINTNEIEGKTGTVTHVKWRFKTAPTLLPPTSVFVKVLKQKSGEQWRFTMVDERKIVVRNQALGEPGTVYAEEIEQFWNNQLPNSYYTPAYAALRDTTEQNKGIALSNLPTGGYQLIPNTPLTINELEFVGFYFPDLQSAVAVYASNTPDDAIEWAMPGNFDWPAEPTPHWSPQMRYTFAYDVSDPNAPINPILDCQHQKTIVNPNTRNWATAITVTDVNPPAAGSYPASGLANAHSAPILEWKQYRGICSAASGQYDLPNSHPSNGYQGPVLNEQNWKEGFVARAKHKDFFGFTVKYESGGAPPCTTPGGCGDPQFIGFQGQNFQFHGMADEVFNLISTPTFQMNGNFKYISAGKCDYNDTACFTHPGTYVDQIGFMIGDIKIKAVSGSHDKGLRAWMNDIEIHRAHAGNNNKIIFAINNSTTETGSFQYTQTGRLALDLPQFHVEIINSDYFFNMEVSLKDTQVLRAGAKQVKLREKVLCAADGMKSEDRMSHVESRMAKHYPRVPIHGLIGQTWRNALICDHPWVGDASDYVTSSLLASDSAFNYYGTQQ